MKKNSAFKYLGRTAVIAGLALTYAACSKKATPAATSSATATLATGSGLLPLVTPIVKAAIPAGLGGTATAKAGFQLSSCPVPANRLRSRLT